MSDLPVQGLLQQLNARPVSGEHLEVLGKHAADLWSAGAHKTLTEAVTETVKHAGLGPEQVRRVIEFTNTHAYLTEFKKEGAPHKVIDFGPGGPADPSEILKDLNDGGGGSVFDRGTLDYQDPPKESKVASARAEQELTELFGTEAPLPFESPLGEAMEVRDKLASANDHLHAQVSGLEIAYADLADRVYQGVKQAALSGVSLSDVMQAWQEVSPSDDHIKLAFELFSPRLLREGVFASLDQMLGSVEKTASVGVVNTEHPLVTDFSEMCEVLSKLAELRAAREEVRESLGSITAFLKEAAGGVIRTVLNAAEKASKPAGAAAQWAGEHAAGQGAGNIAGKVVSTGVKYAPHAAALLGANEVRRRMQYGPVAGRVTNAVLKQIPMTPQYQQHNYDIATGQG
jgi:hypothetical protein